jgi:uncharacterized membrane protein YtjA (UPF0391 family)
MLHYALVFFVIAVIAAVLGFRGVAGLSVEIGWMCAVIAVVILLIGLLGNALGSPPPDRLARASTAVPAITHTWR